MLIQVLSRCTCVKSEFFGESLSMTTEMKRVRELSGILGRMRLLVDLLKSGPEPEQFVVLLRELNELFEDAEGRLRHLGE